MNYCRNVLFLCVCALLIITGCNRSTPEIPSYKPYLEKADTSNTYRMSGGLDTIAYLFKKERPELKDLATYYMLKSMYHKNRGDYTSSLATLDSLKKLLEANPGASFYPKLYPAALLSLAEDYTQLELYDQAIDPLLGAIKFIKENTSDWCSKASYHTRIAQILILQKRNKSAISHLLLGYNAAQTCTSSTFDRFYHSYSSLYKISICYIKLQMFDSAQYYTDAAMNYVVSNQYKIPEKEDYITLCKAVINSNKASIKVHFKQYDEAERLLLSTISQTATVYPHYVLYCKIDLLDVYLRAGKLEQAKELLNFFDTAANNTEMSFTPVQKKNIAKYSKLYYQKTGNYKKAVLFAEKVLNYHDSVQLSNRHKAGRDPELAYKSRAQALNNELLQVEYKRKSLLLSAAVLLIILAVIIAIFIALHSKRTEKHARMQEYLNHEIQLRNDEIKDAYTSLESSYRANTELMLTVAHDLKNPIMGITNLSKLLLKNNVLNFKQNLELIVAASVNATEMIGNLLNRNNREYNVGETKKAGDMMHCAKYCVELMKPKAKQKKQKLNLQGESATVLMNTNEMYRVITNIINNAIKFSAACTTIDILLQKKESGILLSVKDRGIGMPQDISKFPDKADYMELCKAITSGNSAMVKKSLHQYDEAEKLLIAAIDKTNITYPVYAASSRLDLANIYLETGKLKEAKQMLNVVDSIDKTSSPLMDNHRYKLDLYKKNYYTAIGDYQKAMPFYDAAFKYKDSVEFARKMDISRDPGLEFEKKVQIAANELLKAQYGQRSFQLLAAVLLMVLVLIVTVFIWLHLKRTARHAKILEYLNHEIHLKNTDIKDAYASLESSYRANKMLLQIVAHDLKNPIVGITNLAKLLAKNASTPDLKENLSHIVTASTTATNLINNLMDKKEKKYEEIEKEVNDMTGLLQYCTELMKPKAEQKKQKLLLTAAPAKALINKDEMWRVITNIINNAIKFSPENTSIDIRLQEQDSKVLLSVKDQGIGIPPNMLTVLFTAGPEIQRSGTAGEPSYGLGLKISKRIVEEHHGQLRVESVEGEGTTFYVILPAA